MIKRSVLALGLVVWLAGGAFSQFSFYLIDNFEPGEARAAARWWKFGNLVIKVAPKPKALGNDLIAESCGETSLSLSGDSENWYVGGIGTDLDIPEFDYSRFQIDIYGTRDGGGKLSVELFDDDNQNFSIEQDPANNYMPVYDDKWVAEVPIQGEGFTRISIPFSAFRDVNPGVGDDIWNPVRNDGSGGLLKLQLVAISEQQAGKVSFLIDNVLLTY